MPRVHIAIGSNHNRQQNIAMALGALQKRFQPLAVSPVYASDGVEDDGRYYNLVVSFVCQLTPEALRAYLREMEEYLDRQRKDKIVTIDLDLLLYGDRQGQVAGQQLPHPDLFRYRHVAQPLADLAPELELPGGLRAADLLREDQLPPEDLEALTREPHEIRGDG